MSTTDDDLAIARHLAESGVPIFIARRSDEFPKGGSGNSGYWFPDDWQTTEADPTVVDRYKSGDALCAVMGHTVDGLDRDVQKGGELPPNVVPFSYGKQRTPSGGTHDLIAPLGVRSRDGVAAGVDVKAGLDGKGIGFLFLAPTEKMSKTTGEIGQYEWVEPPVLDTLVLVGGDESGRRLAELVDKGRRKTEGGLVSYTGPTYDQLTPSQKAQAEEHQTARLDLWRQQLEDAVDWPDGETDLKGRGWEALSRDAAWMVATLAVNPWTPLQEAEAFDVYLDLMPDEISSNRKCLPGAKFHPGILEKAAANSVDQPPWTEIEFDPINNNVLESAGLPPSTDDAILSGWMAETGLKGQWCWAAGLGWLRWDGRRWQRRTEEEVRDTVRRKMIEINVLATDMGVDARLMKLYRALKNGGKINGIVSLMRGIVVHEASAFDQKLDFLNCGNGVVDLRTGKLIPHDPGLLMTKITETEYHPGAEHADWKQALEALDPEVRDWMQIRFGQAATGYPTSDDILPISQGAGSNGKSTILAALFSALGDHMVLVPEKLIRASPNDHPTEMMTLHGTRVAVIDETPEASQLNIPRLKSVLGNDRITARLVHKDNISWKATHSLFVMTNYVPRVTEIDHGTWRRLALVKFDKKFPRDDRFRARIQAGETREAALAWVVEGARLWYKNHRVIPSAPPKVEADTDEWRLDADQIMGFALGALVFEPDSMILGLELLEEMNEWLQAHGQARWSEQTFSSRFKQHEKITNEGVKKTRTRDLSRLSRRFGNSAATLMLSNPTVWSGVRFRTEEDE